MKEYKDIIQNWRDGFLSVLQSDIGRPMYLITNGFYQTDYIYDKKTLCDLGNHWLSRDVGYLSSYHIIDKIKMLDFLKYHGCFVGEDRKEPAPYSVPISMINTEFGVASGSQADIESFYPGDTIILGTSEVRRPLRNWVKVLFDKINFFTKS